MSKVKLDFQIDASGNLKAKTAKGEYIIFDESDSVNGDLFIIDYWETKANDFTWTKKCYTDLSDARDEAEKHANTL